MSEIRLSRIVEESTPVKEFDGAITRVDSIPYLATDPQELRCRFSVRPDQIIPPFNSYSVRAQMPVLEKALKEYMKGEFGDAVTVEYYHGSHELGSVDVDGPLGLFYAYASQKYLPQTQPE